MKTGGFTNLEIVERFNSLLNITMYKDPAQVQNTYAPKRKCIVLCIVPKKKNKAMEKQQQKANQTNIKNTTSQENLPDIDSQRRRGLKLNTERTYCMPEEK